MKRILYSLTVLCAVHAVALYAISSALSYELNGGRFGDNIRSFTQAYWESYKHDLPLLYVPFPGSEELVLHTQFQERTPDVQAQYRETKVIGEFQQIIQPYREDILYITTYFCRTDIDWKDPEFVKQVVWLFSPRTAVELPEDIDTAIALHVRRGGGFHVDTHWVIASEPAHFPSLTYFARSLDYLLTQIEGTYPVYLFTDDPNPPALAEQLQNLVRPETAHRIEFRYRVRDNFHDRHVIEDFAAMRRCRYLIRPISNFSEYAELMGNFACTVIPGRHRRGNPFGIIESAVFLYKDRPADVVMLL